MLRIQKFIFCVCFLPTILMAQAAAVPKAKANNGYVLQALPMETVSSGCGSFLGFKQEVSSTVITYIFATSVDQNGMVIKINEKLYYFQGSGSGISGGGEVGSKFDRSWKNEAVTIFISGKVTDSSYESVSFEGNMTVKFKGIIKHFKVVGSEGC